MITCKKKHPLMDRLTLSQSVGKWASRRRFRREPNIFSARFLLFSLALAASVALQVNRGGAEVILGQFWNNFEHFDSSFPLDLNSKKRLQKCVPRTEAAF